MIASRMRHARGVDEPPAEVARAEGEAEEPDDARDDGAGGEHPALVAVRVRDGAEQEDGVEVHVRVQPRQREAREHDRQEPGAWSRVGEAPAVPRGTVASRASSASSALPLGRQRPPRGQEAVADEERRARPADDVDEPRHRVQHESRRPRRPATMRTASESAQIAATTKTCSRRMPCRSTNRFCAPIATMSEKPRPRPASRGVSTLRR